MVASQEMDPQRCHSVQAEEDRKPLIESAIVRVMKSRKRLDHRCSIYYLELQWATLDWSHI